MKTALAIIFLAGCKAAPIATPVVIQPVAPLRARLEWSNGNSYGWEIFPTMDACDTAMDNLDPDTMASCQELPKDFQLGGP